MLLKADQLVFRRGPSAARAPADWPEPVPGPGEIVIHVSTPAVFATPRSTRSRGGCLLLGSAHHPGPSGRGAGRDPGRGHESLPPRRPRLGRVDLLGVRSPATTAGGARRTSAPVTGRPAPPPHGGYAERMIVPEAFAHRHPVFSPTARPCLRHRAGAIGFPIAPPDPPGKRPGPGPDRLRRLGAPGLEAGPAPVPRQPGSSSSCAARQSGPSPARSVQPGPATAPEPAPEPLGAIIDTTPAWTPIVAVLGNLEPGGRLVINAIRKEAVDKEALLRARLPRATSGSRRRSRASPTSLATTSASSSGSRPRSRSPQVQEFALGEANQCSFPS